MSEEAQAALRTEMSDIMSNPQNPLHAGYQRDDPEVSKQIDAKYKAVYGDGQVDVAGSGIGTTVTLDLEKVHAKADPVEAVSGDDPKENAAMMETLHKEWGQDFGAKHEHAKAGLLNLEQMMGQDRVEEILGNYLAEGGTRVEAMRFLARHGRTLTKS